MCLNDWRLGRLIKSQSRKFTATGGFDAICNPSLQRVGILLSGVPLVTSDFITFNIRRGPITTRVVVGSVTLFNPLLFFNVTEHGDLPTLQFEAVDTTALLEIDVTEFFLPESTLTEGLEQLQSPYKP